MTVQPTYPNPHNRGRTIIDDLAEYLADILRSEFGGNPEGTYDVNAMAADVRTWADKLALSGDAPHNMAQAVGEGTILNRATWYRFDGEGSGVPILDDADLSAWMKRRNRQRMFGVDGARDLEAPARATEPNPAPDFAGRWPSAFEMYEAEMARLRAAANN